MRTAEVSVVCPCSIRLVWYVNAFVTGSMWYVRTMRLSTPAPSSVPLTTTSCLSSVSARAPSRSGDAVIVTYPQSTPFSSMP